MAPTESLLEARPWAPIPGNDFVAKLGRLLSFFSYPMLAPYAIFSHGGSTIENARWFRTYFAILGLSGSIAGHVFCYKRWGMQQPLCPKHIASQVVFHLSWDFPYTWLFGISNLLIKVFQVRRNENRLNAGRLHGPRVLVVGNGPSAMEGEARGKDIDKFDEVVRFNNFMTKVGGLEERVGSKTTVHFSDGMLFPTFSEYHVPGATVVLSLFCDRYMVSGSYFIMRGGADLRPGLTRDFLMDPDTTWISKENIERLKKALGLKSVKHPTSGMLAIDYFVNKPGVQLPVIIHGFDFFMGPTIHYFNKHEPLYERINNHIGVNMHSPHLEKIYVEKLIAEGKVKFLKDV